jgi:hypothetical protein
MPLAHDVAVELRKLADSLVQAAIPAKYSCDPILSLEEEEAL